MNAPEMYSLMQGVTGVNAFAATCQSALETGRWMSKLWVQARNGAGLKAGRSWINAGKPFIPILSPEWNGKEIVHRISKFRAYATPEEFVADYAGKIREFYPKCVESADNFWGYFAGLYHGKWGAWATDPRYFDKLCRMAVSLAPELLGKGWRGRIYLAFELAEQRDTLTPEQGKTILKLLKEANEE